MQAKREYRDRNETEVAVLDALVDRAEEGMTVFELRSGVESGIDEIERALGNLKEEELIHVENDENPMRIYPAERVIPDQEGDVEDRSLLDRILERLTF